MCAPYARCDNGLFIIGFDNDRYRRSSALCAHHVPRKPCVLGSGLRVQRAFIGAVLLSPLHPQPCPKPHAHPPPLFVLAVVCASRPVITLRPGLRAKGAGGLHWRGLALPPAPSALPLCACPPTTLVVCLSGHVFHVFLGLLVGVGGSAPVNPRHNKLALLIYIYFYVPCNQPFFFFFGVVLRPPLVFIVGSLFCAAGSHHPLSCGRPAGARLGRPWRLVGYPDGYLISSFY